MVKDYFCKSLEITKKIIEDDAFCLLIDYIANICIDAYRNDKKILVCGNGGSASDALHMTGELVGRFQKERKGIPAIALNENIAVMTALANDYSYDQIFQKQVVAYGKTGDILIGISTSGSSVNIVNAIIQAKKMGIKTIGMTGESGGKMKGLCDCLLNVPSSETAHIQEIHICIIHVLCKIIEEKLF